MSTDYFTTVSDSLNGTSITYSFENVKAEALVENDAQEGLAATNLGIGSDGITIYEPNLNSGSATGLGYAWKKLIPGLGMFGNDFNLESGDNTLPNAGFKVRGTTGTSGTRTIYDGLTFDKYSVEGFEFSTATLGTHCHPDISDNCFINYVHGVPYETEQGNPESGVILGPPGTHLWGFYCVWDLKTGEYSADYRYWDNSTKIGRAHV